MAVASSAGISVMESGEKSRRFINYFRSLKAMPAEEAKMVVVWECLLMKLTADQYYYAYFSMLEEPAMLKPLSYLSEFVSICQP